MNRNLAKHFVFNVSYYLIWIPKYRHSILVNEVENLLKKLLIDKSSSTFKKI